MGSRLICLSMYSGSSPSWGHATSCGAGAGRLVLILGVFFVDFFLYLFSRFDPSGSLFGATRGPGMYSLGVGFLGIGPAPFTLGTGPAAGAGAAFGAAGALGIRPLLVLAFALGVGPAVSVLVDGPGDGTAGLTY